MASLGLRRGVSTLQGLFFRVYTTSRVCQAPMQSNPHALCPIVSHCHHQHRHSLAPTHVCLLVCTDTDMSMAAGTPIHERMIGRPGGAASGVAPPPVPNGTPYGGMATPVPVRPSCCGPLRVCVRGSHRAFPSFLHTSPDTPPCYSCRGHLTLNTRPACRPTLQVLPLWLPRNVSASPWAEAPRCSPKPCLPLQNHDDPVDTLILLLRAP